MNKCLLVYQAAFKGVHEYMSKLPSMNPLETFKG